MILNGDGYYWYRAWDSAEPEIVRIRTQYVFRAGMTDYRLVGDMVHDGEFLVKVELPGTPQPPVARAENDLVNQPYHYTFSENPMYEVILVIEAWGLDKDFLLANCIKYIARSEHKGSQLQDLKKSQWYLNRKIQNLGDEDDRN